MSVTIAICDDSSEDTEKLSKALYAYDPLLEIISYSSGRTLIDELSDGYFNADILFLDIYMPGLDGIQTAQKVCSLRKDLKVIFLTTSMDHYPQAYEVFAYNYIVKPFSPKRLYDVLERALHELRKERSYKITIQYKGTLHTVDCREILYIESQNKLLLFHLSDQSILKRYGKLEEVTQELPKQYFFAVTKAFW